MRQWPNVEPATQNTHLTRTAKGGGTALLLLAAYITCFAQRQVPATMAGPMARHYDLSDGEMGGLIGYGFGFFYAVLALPAGWLVDRFRRTWLLAAGLALASLATIASALDVGIAVMIVLRLLVGVGQSVLVPAAYSLLGDTVARQNMGRTVAGFSVGPFLGAGIMLILGGQLASDMQWWVAFALAGSAGLMLSVVVAWVREPERKAATQIHDLAGDLGPYLKQHWWPVLAADGALTFTAMAGHTILAWGAVWLMRAHEVSAGNAALGLGLAVLVGGVVGTLAAGSGSDHLLKGRRCLSRLHLLAGAMLVGSVMATAIFLCASLSAALIGLPVLIALIAASLTLASTALQDITPPNLRGRQHGFAILLVNWIGLGFGPLLIGFVSDLRGGAAAIGTVLGIALPIMLILSAGIAISGAAAHARGARNLAQA